MNQGYPHGRHAVCGWERRRRCSPHTGLLAHEAIEVEEVAVARFGIRVRPAVDWCHATRRAYPGLAVEPASHGSRGLGIITTTSSILSRRREPGDDDRRRRPTRRQMGQRRAWCEGQVGDSLGSATGASTTTSSTRSTGRAPAVASTRRCWRWRWLRGMGIYMSGRLGRSPCGRRSPCWHVRCVRSTGGCESMEVSVLPHPLQSGLRPEAAVSWGTQGWWAGVRVRVPTRPARPRAGFWAGNRATWRLTGLRRQPAGPLARIPPGRPGWNYRPSGGIRPQSRPGQT